VIAKAEVTDKGPDPRYVVTNLEGEAQALYDEVYCERGEMETALRSSNSGFLLTAPVAATGGLTNSGCC